MSDNNSNYIEETDEHDLILEASIQQSVNQIDIQIENQEHIQIFDP